MLDHALRYASFGFRVFPVRLDKSPYTAHGHNDASTNEATIRDWWARFPDAGIGIATGIVSGIVVLDVDLDKEGTEDSLRTLVQRFGSFSQTVVCRTGGGGYHVYFRHPGSEFRVPNATKLFGLTGIDVRGDGGYVIAPPSNHLSGNRYEWGTNQSPFDAPMVVAPEFLYLVGHSRQAITLTSEIREGERNATLASIAGLLRSMGMDEGSITAVLLQQNAARCVPPLSDAEVQTIASSIAQYPPYQNRVASRVATPPGDEPESTPPSAALWDLLRFPRDDAGYADMVAFVFGTRIRYDHTRGTWLLWRTHHWEPDGQAEIMRLVVETARLYQQAIPLMQNEEEQAIAARFGAKLANAGTISNAMSLLRGHPVVSTVQTRWNLDDHLIAAQNGVIDLRTGMLAPGRPEQNISLHIPIEYDSQATCPRWESFLREIFLDDPEVLTFVKRAVGYSLTGSTREQCLFLLIGSGSNGKSVLLQTLISLLGSYGSTTPFSTFERNAMTSSMSNDVAALVGKRLVIASEVNEGMYINESRVKSLTGGEEITARYLHQEFFTFRPVAKIWLAVNHLPRVRDDSDGFWRRVRRIDCRAQIPRERQDRDLQTKLFAELPGILNWALEGAMEWYREGLPIPASIIEATALYRSDSDPLHDFFSTYCELGPSFKIAASDLHNAYRQYCIEKELKPNEVIGYMRFRARLTQQFQREITPAGDVIIGIHLSEKGLTQKTAGQVTINLVKTAPLN